MDTQSPENMSRSYHGINNYKDEIKMKSTIFIESTKGNLYLYDFLKKEIIPCHPLIQVFDLLDRKNLLDDLYRIIDGENSDMADKYKREDIDYYLNKYLNYKKCGYFSFFKKREALEYDVEQYLEDLEDAEDAMRLSEAVARGEEKVYSAEDVRRRLGLGD